MLDLPQPLVDAFWATVQALLGIVAPALAALAVAKTVDLALIAWMRFKADRPQLAWEIEQAADLAVKSAEQQGLTGQLIKFAISKKDYAIQIATSLLKANGVKVDLVLLDAIIESKVLENFPKKPAPPAVEPATEPA